MERTITPVSLLAAAVAALALFIAAPAAPTHAAVDLTGSWQVSLEASGLGQTDCSGSMEQTGDSVEATFECGADGSGTLTGTLTQEDNGAGINANIVLETTNGTINASAEGTVSGDGNSMSGTWESDFFGGLNGTFEGQRLAFAKGDLNCDESVDSKDVLVAFTHLAGLQPAQGPLCPSISSGVLAIFGDMDCDMVVGIPDGRHLLLYTAGAPDDLGQGCQPIGLQ